MILHPPPVLIACGGVQTSQQTDNCTIGTWRTGETEPCKKEGRLTGDVNDGGWGVRGGDPPHSRLLVVKNIRIIRTILRFIVDCIQ